MAKGNESREFIAKLVGLSEADQTSTANEHIRVLFQAAEQPGHSSNEACLKLCFFIEQCRKSNSQPLREIAMSSKTCLDLFNFYIEWNERHQHKSMRQILELSSTLVTAQKDEVLSKELKSQILERSLAIIAHQGPQPLVKPAFKALELYFMKKSVSPADLLDVYDTRILQDASIHKSTDVATVLDSFVLSIFEWMTLQDVAPSAGKFLVSLFAELDGDLKIASLEGGYSSQWKRWLHEGLGQYPESLENIQRHLLPPLFKTDREGSVLFLQQLTELKSLPLLESGGFDASAFLFLAAMEAGKKLGLVEEPEPVKLSKAPGKVRSHVLLPEDIIGELLVHPAGIVRTSALSVLITSSAPGRPFTDKALSILRDNISYLHADTDAKFRNEVLSSTRHLAERLRAATANLKREFQSLEYAHQANLNSSGEEIHKVQAHADPLLSATSGATNADTARPPQQIAVALQSHLDFLSWYLEFLSAELVPTASYQRHITSLRAIQLFIRSDVAFPFQENPTITVNDASQFPPTTSPSAIFTVSIIRLLLDSLADPFEDVRVAAAEVLKSAPRICFDDNDTETVDNTANMSDLSNPKRRLRLLKTCKTRLELASESSGRADQADGVSRCHELVYYFASSDAERLDIISEMVSALEKKTAKAEEDLNAAVEMHPIHGQFASINTVWKLVNRSNYEGIFDDPAWQEIQGRILKCCKTIWNLVSEILCDDSPEGLELEDAEDDSGADTKDVLSYGWRAVHESSRLTETMAQGLMVLLFMPEPFLSREAFKDIGELAFDQLARLRHRGAFSTVFSTFSSVCKIAQQVFGNKEQSEPLLESWFIRAQEVLHQVKSTTRRSAGIPMMFTAIMAAGSNNPSFDDIMRTLISLACTPIISKEDGTNLFQVHALNCLRETFKSSILGRKSEPYIPEGISIASACLKSSKWAIRNCGLLLFRSLIDRLFGTSESKSITENGWNGKAIQLDYGKYPGLPETLLEMLTIEPTTALQSSIDSIESVFPALDIIRRAGPPPELKEEFRNVVCSHLFSPAWHVREIAARTLATMISRQSWYADLDEYFMQEVAAEENRKHGCLLLTQHVLQRQLTNTRTDQSTRQEELRQFASLANRLGELGWWQNKCSPYTVATRELCYKLIVTGLTEYATYTDRSISRSAQESYGVKLLIQDNLLPEVTWQNAMERNTAYERVLAVLTYHEDIERLGPLLRSMEPEEAETALLVLDGIHNTWKLDSLDKYEAGSMARVFADAYAKFEDGRVRACCLDTLAQLLDVLAAKSVVVTDSKLKPVLSDAELRSLLSDLKPLLSDSVSTPELTNASVRFTGSLLCHDVLFEVDQSASKCQLSSELKAKIALFGHCMMENGTPMEEFDTRFAVVGSLQAFAGCVRLRPVLKASRDPCFAPVYLAILDMLVDDDDEIRDGAAEAAANLTGNLNIPLKTASSIACELVQSFPPTLAIRQGLLLRLTGCVTGDVMKDSLISVERQLAVALKENNTLFVQEEQNLFFDEVRETERIATAIVEAIKQDNSRWFAGWDKTLVDGGVWACSGLRSLISNMQIDGPFGWCSRPEVFAICMRVVIMASIFNRVADVVAEMYAMRSDLTEVFEWSAMKIELNRLIHLFYDAGLKKNIHPELLNRLRELLGDRIIRAGEKSAHY